MSSYESESSRAFWSDERRANEALERKADATLDSQLEYDALRKTIFSPCRCYRYTLWREWQSTSLWPCSCWNQYLMVIGLNPSTADETQDDPTIRRCIDFAKRWGFGALCMTNLFAFRATDPEVMKAQPEPCGMENGNWLCEIAQNAGMILAAWGKHGRFQGRDRNVLSAIRAIGKPVYCLERNKDGTPKHPLYVRADCAVSVLA